MPGWHCRETRGFPCGACIIDTQLILTGAPLTMHLLLPHWLLNTVLSLLKGLINLYYNLKDIRVAKQIASGSLIPVDCLPLCVSRWCTIASDDHWGHAHPGTPAPSYLPRLRCIPLSPLPSDGVPSVYSSICTRL